MSWKPGLRVTRGDHCDEEYGEVNVVRVGWLSGVTGDIRKRQQYHIFKPLLNHSDEKGGNCCRRELLSVQTTPVVLFRKSAVVTPSVLEHGYVIFLAFFVLCEMVE